MFSNSNVFACRGAKIRMCLLTVGLRMCLLAVEWVPEQARARQPGGSSHARALPSRAEQRGMRASHAPPRPPRAAPTERVKIVLRVKQILPYFILNPFIHSFHRNDERPSCAEQRAMRASHVPPRPPRAVSTGKELNLHKVFVKSFCKSQFPYKSVNLSLLLPI